jgi:hypothetical protein
MTGMRDAGMAIITKINHEDCDPPIIDPHRVTKFHWSKPTNQNTQTEIHDFKSGK